jgi:peptide/nickel transport system permease protein
VSVLLIWWLSVRWGWFPAYGAGTGFTGRLQHLTLPALALAAAWIAYVAQVTRSAVRAERVVRGAALRECRLPYVCALRMLGMSGWRICLRHLMPNLLPPVLTQVAVSFGYTLLDVAALSFIGLGAQPPTAEWGLMVANGSTGILAGRAEQSLYAGAVIVVFVVACNLLGSGLSRRSQGDSR